MNKIFFQILRNKKKWINYNRNNRNIYNNIFNTSKKYYFQKLPIFSTLTNSKRFIYNYLKEKINYFKENDDQKKVFFLKK